VERYFGSHQDIEWAIARGGDLPDSLFVVQSRPVTGTRAPAQARKSSSAIDLVMGTFGAGPAKKD
jgi:pyruvate, water dikinase